MSQCEDPSTCPTCKEFRESPEGVAIAEGLAKRSASALEHRMLTPGRARDPVTIQERRARVVRRKLRKKQKGSRRRNRR